MKLNFKDLKKLYTSVDMRKTIILARYWPQLKTEKKDL